MCYVYRVRKQSFSPYLHANRVDGTFYTTQVCVEHCLAAV